MIGSLSSDLLLASHSLHSSIRLLFLRHLSTHTFVGFVSIKFICFPYSLPPSGRKKSLRPKLRGDKTEKILLISQGSCVFHFIRRRKKKFLAAFIPVIIILSTLGEPLRRWALSHRSLSSGPVAPDAAAAPVGAALAARAAPGAAAAAGEPD